MGCLDWAVDEVVPVTEQGLRGNVQENIHNIEIAAQLLQVHDADLEFLYKEVLRLHRAIEALEVKKDSK